MNKPIIFKYLPAFVKKNPYNGSLESPKKFFHKRIKPEKYCFKGAFCYTNPAET
jgi:hypothetical protein